MAALRALLAEGERLPLNGPNAAGWVHQGAVWFEAARLLDAVRLRLSARGPDRPEDDQDLVERWRAYGALMTEPQGGEPRWRVVVAGEGYRLERVVLRFPLQVLYAAESMYPEGMTGTIEVRTPGAGQGGSWDAGAQGEPRESGGRVRAGQGRYSRQRMREVTRRQSLSRNIWKPWNHRKQVRRRHSEDPGPGDIPLLHVTCACPAGSGGRAGE